MAQDRHLGPGEIARLLRIVEPAAPIIVGGQAISIWAERYRARLPDLFDEGPVTSKDLDFLRNERAVECLEVALQARVQRPGMDDVTPEAARVTATLGDRIVDIDFMNDVLGTDRRAVAKRAVRLVGPAGAAGEVRMTVLHPLDCLRSRLANVNRLHRTDGHSVRQARIAVRVLEAFVQNLVELGERRHAQDVLMECEVVVGRLHRGRTSHVEPRHGIRPEMVPHAFLEAPGLDLRWRELTLRPSVERTARRLSRSDQPPGTVD